MTFGNYTTTVVATVDQNGKVTAVSNGTANITVTTQDVFVQNFDESNIISGEMIPENLENPDIFSEISADDAYVEGRWAGEGHKDQGDKSKITITKFGDQPWSKILAKYGNTKTNRKYFLWGAAIHLVSDSFAHRIWYKDNGKVGKYINHPDADKPSKCKNRFKVAGDAVSSIVSSLEIDVEGHFADIGWAILDEFNNTFVR